MRCMMCGAEMILMKVVEDETMAVPGFERQAYMFSVCYDTENRLVFNKHAKERDTEAVPVLTPPPIAPTSTIQNSARNRSGFLGAGASQIARPLGTSSVHGALRRGDSAANGKTAKRMNR